MLGFDMAGGPLAQEIWCFECYAENKITKATRVYEGAEDDKYRCELGHEFGVDYRKGPATEPQWPPPAELVASVNEN
jgi:hypothetical protein